MTSDHLTTRVISAARRTRITAVALLIALCVAPLGHAGEVYRWTDDKGIVHYGGQRPAGLSESAITSIPFQAEPGAPARLRIVEGDDGIGYYAVADNLLAGPVQVRLQAGAGAAIVGEPELPARATVPALGSVVVSRIRSASPGAGGRFELSLQAVPGPPDARPLDVEYAFPLQQPAPRVAQGWGGRYSHTDPENHHAVDFAAEIGTPVLAARDGVVMEVESDFDRPGLSAERFGDRANFLRILHDDGTMAVYAHLQPDGVLASVGQRVRRGQQIGLSGNTGFTTGPHLHFVVQVNRNMALVSVPFRMFSPRGILRFDESGEGGSDAVPVTGSR